jgi:Ca2+-binding EF-hand superfamily protein
MDALRNIGLVTSKQQVYTFLRTFDFDGDGWLLYSDFSDAFTPKEKYFAQQIVIRCPQYVNTSIPKHRFFEDATREEFMACLSKLMEAEESIELSKQRVSRRPRFNVRDAFDHLDCFDRGVISRDEIKELLNKNHIYPTEIELGWLTDRFDKKRIGRISYDQFVEELLPKNSIQP